MTRPPIHKGARRIFIALILSTLAAFAAALFSLAEKGTLTHG